MLRIAPRLRILFLATLYVAGNFGLPATDLLLNHRSPETRHAGQSHFEGPGGCREHADHCVLARLLNDFRLQAPGTPQERPRLPSAVASTARAVSAIAVSTPSRSHRSRAPPVLV
jgi:hypothetical protein